MIDAFYNSFLHSLVRERERKFFLYCSVDVVVAVEVLGEAVEGGDLARGEDAGDISMEGTNGNWNGLLWKRAGWVSEEAVAGEFGMR